LAQAPTLAAIDAQKNDRLCFIHDLVSHVELTPKNGQFYWFSIILRNTKVFRKARSRFPFSEKSISGLKKRRRNGTLPRIKGIRPTSLVGNFSTPSAIRFLKDHQRP
jgi:hypothetical protein